MGAKSTPELANEIRLIWHESETSGEFPWPEAYFFRPDASRLKIRVIKKKQRLKPVYLSKFNSAVILI